LWPRDGRGKAGLNKDALIASLGWALLLLLWLWLCCLLLLELLRWFVMLVLLSIVGRRRRLSTLPLPLLLLLLRVMTRHSAHRFMYECAQVASMFVGSQLMDQLVGLVLRPRLYLSDESSRFVALVLECTITAT
jgi:hypothetical protein